MATNETKQTLEQELLQRVEKLAEYLGCAGEPACNGVESCYACETLERVREIKKHQRAESMLAARRRGSKR